MKTRNLPLPHYYMFNHMLFLHCASQILLLYLFSAYTQRFDNDPDSIFQDYPPYPDPFASTYRGMKGWSFDPSKVSLRSRVSLKKQMTLFIQIVEWIAHMNDIWDFSESTMNYLDCQKRAVCEIWR